MSRYRKTGKGGDLLRLIEHEYDIDQKNTFISKRRDLIAWESFRPLPEEITGYDQRDGSKSGQLHFDPAFMFKITVPKKSTAPPTTSLGKTIFDRASFKNFLGLRLGDGVPDTKTFETSSSASNRARVPRSSMRTLP